MSIFTKEGDDKVLALTEANEALTEANKVLTEANAALVEKTAFIEAKDSIRSKALALGVVVANLDTFVTENEGIGAQVEALFALKEVQVTGNTKEFLASGTDAQGEGEPTDERIYSGNDDFVPSSKREALAYIKKEMPDLSARDRQTEAVSLYPKLWS